MYMHIGPHPPYIQISVPLFIIILLLNKLAETTQMPATRSETADFHNAWIHTDTNKEETDNQLRINMEDDSVSTGKNYSNT